MTNLTCMKNEAVSNYKRLLNTPTCKHNISLSKTILKTSFHP